MKITLLSKYLVTTVLGLGFITTLLYARTQIANNTTINPSPTPTQTVSPTSSPTVKGTTTTKTQVVNSDPIVDCVSSYPNCNGESIRLKQSQCKNIICCGFSDGRWVVYPSRDKCEQAQKGSQPIAQPQQQTFSTSNKVPVFLTYGKYTIYCPSQNVDAVKSIDATMTSKSQEWAKNYNSCADNYYKTNSCYVSCYDTETSQLNVCYSLYGYSGPEYDTCSKAAYDGYGTCINGCTPPNQTCDYVYYEQKSLSSQITNLCK